jgi:hypothetical protein
MAGLIHLELLTDFFNKIGPSRHVVLRRVSVAFGAKRTLVLCNWFRRRLAAPMARPPSPAGGC